VENSDTNRSRSAYFKIDFDQVTHDRSAIVLFLDGGPRNFQFLQSVFMECNRVYAERTINSFLPRDVEENNKHGPLFQTSGRARKTYKGLSLCCFYKDGWNALTDKPKWVMKVFFDPVFVSSLKDKLEKVTQMVIYAVPALEKFRPHLFSSIRDICAALSSHSLPKLKKKFQRSEEGLHIGQFTEVIFKQLYETHPRIIDDSEAPYAVSMLQEMFHQIDYNGDGGTNWDEFTTFCVQTGLTTANTRRGNRESGYSLDQYVIEYGEEVLHRDHILSAYRFVAQMRHIPETRKIILIPEDSDNILILTEQYQLHAQVYPNKIQVLGSLGKKAMENRENGGSGGNKDKDKDKKIIVKAANAPKAMIYDAVYLSGRDLYAYTASDHSITICKELSSVNGMKVNFLQHNRFYHNLLHLKLCWSEKHDLLCSTASDRVIYGWNIDNGHILFQISRHSDIITDFLAVDQLDIFITSSMDKRIVLWSSITRRVKGVLLGHSRGVRTISVFDTLLLSAGFECEAKTWDLVTKECICILKGHRHPIVAAKLMCEKAQSEKEHRAITVDESAEFRVWNIYIRERSTDPIYATTIQTFGMQNPESPLNQFRFLAIPYNPKSTTSYYSDLIACSTKLLHFVPEKNMKEFVPPTAFVCHEAGASLITAVGKNILTYDLATGEFDQVFESVSQYEIFAICMDGERGRRMYIGLATGEIMLINSVNGIIISKVQYHTKEVTCLCQRKAARTNLFSISMDGHMRVYEENSGKIHLQNSIDSVFGEGIGLSSLKLVPTLNLMLVTSTSKTWGLLNDTTYKKLLVIHEAEPVTALEIVGASRDNIEDDLSKSNSLSVNSQISLKENLLTIAIALTKCICIYILDTQDLRGIKAFELHHDTPIYINQLMVMKSGDVRSVNYSSIRAGQSFEPGAQQLIACTDDGKVVVWEIGTLRSQGEEKFHLHYKQPVKTKKQQRKKNHNLNHNDDFHYDINKRRNSNASVNSDSSNRAFLTGLEHVDFHTVNEAHNAVRRMGLNKKSPNHSFLGNNQPTWLEYNSKDLFPVSHQPKNNQINVSNSPVSTPPQNRKTRRISQAPMGTTIIHSDRCWNAHLDNIPIMVSLQSHGCFVTVSHDGYHRVWNLDAECLGELILPNISEQMKAQAMCKEPGSQWRFILERLPVTKHHVDIANVLVKSILQTRQDKLDHMSSFHSRHLNVPFGFKGFRESSSDEESEENDQTKFRKNILKSLTEPPKFAEDPPPSRLPTKEEKELIRLAFSSDRNNNMNGSSSSILAGSSTISSVEDLTNNNSFLSLPGTTVSNKSLANITNVTSPLSKRKLSPGTSRKTAILNQDSIQHSLLFNGDNSVCLSSFGVPSLWIVPGEKDINGKPVMPGRTDMPLQVVPPAFSEASIASLLREGAIDVEGHRILRSINLKPDRVQVYDRSQPTLLMRSPSMSTNVQLPPLDNLSKTEIHFGSQKVSYI
jgi:hypothetical protein